jgi:hypothetical protein
MKTAVEWLYEQILLTPLDIRSINKCLEQAKEMEKEQLCALYLHLLVNTKDIMEFDFETWYNEKTNR